MVVKSKNQQDLQNLIVRHFTGSVIRADLCTTGFAISLNLAAI
jgi:hypothetical protein